MSRSPRNHRVQALLNVRHWKLSSFEALRNRAYRWFWSGRIAVSAGFEMSAIAQGWLVYELTGSAFALSWVGTGRSLMMFLFSPYGGVVCDRVEKRSMLLWTRLATVVNLSVVTLLVALGHIQIWHLALSALLAGLLNAFMMPAQQSIVPELVDRRILLNAISLNSIGMGLTAIIADSTTGYLIDWLGVAGAYAAMTALNVYAAFSVSRLPRGKVGECTQRSAWQDMRAGLGYLRAQPTLQAIIAVVLIRVLFIMPYRTFMPKYVSDVLGLDAAGLGVLLAAAAIGALVTSFSVASSGDFRGKGRLVIIGGFVAGIAMLALWGVRSLPLAFLTLIFVGVGNNICMVTGNTLLQMHCAPEYRGRVMGVDMMIWGLAPLGTLPAGALADGIGAAPVMGIMGLLTLGCFLALGTLTPHLRRLD
jgi:MFS family permease